MTPRKKSMLAMFFGALSIVAIGLVSIFFYGNSADDVIEGVPHSFVYGYRATQNTTDCKVIVEVLQFQVSPNRTFTALLRGPRGEKAAIEDLTLPDNTLVWSLKLSPSVILSSGMVFQPAVNYIETRYHISKKEPQGLIPHLGLEPCQNE